MRRELTSGAGRKWSPRAIGSDRVVYFAEGEGGGIEVVGGRRGARGEFRNPSWSSDGGLVVFHREMDTAWPPHHAWRSKDSGFELVRTGIYPSAAPSGGRYAVNSAPAGILKNAIWIRQRDGSSHTVVYSHETASALAPMWSPTGDRLVFGLGEFFEVVFGRGAGPEAQRRGADIAVVGTDGSGFRRLTTDGNRGFPSWAPDGQRVVYRALGTVGKGLVILNVTTGEERPLTTTSYNDNFPAWLPKGDVIAFTSNRAGWRDEAALHPFNAQNGDIYVMRPDGSDVRMLTDDTFEKATPGFLR